MKRLLIKKLIIISPKSHEAKIVEFDAKITVITGDNPDGTTINRTGKSLVMKCLYYSLGANLKKYTANWHNLQLSTIVTFEYDGHDYELYRCDDRFVFRDGDAITKFETIADLREYYVDFFNFKIKLPVKETDTKTVYAYPGSIFMPFYIDQDKGWAGSWDSFSDIFSGKWKTEILLYHMGIRTPQYYSLLEEKVLLELDQRSDKQKEQTLATIIESHITKYGDFLDISFEIEEFEEDIAALTKELNNQLSEKNSIKEELVRCLNEMNDIESLYAVAQKNYNELLSDMEYVESNISEESIICPVCGTSHKNDVQNRFSLYSEISECEDTMNSYFSQRSKIEKRIGLQSEKLKSLDAYISKVNSILSQKRDSVSFHDVIVSEGSKSILEDMREDLAKVKAHLFEIEERLKEIRNEQAAITKEGKHISDLYLSHLRSNLSSLDVTDIDQRDLEKITPSFKSGGNDLPCAILAQVYAIYEVASKYSYTAQCPIVLDAIFQQEPAKEKIQTIWEFLINSQPKDSQLIISTTEMHDYKVDGKIITLLEERGLLNIADYEKEKETIQRYKSIGLQK